MFVGDVCLVSSLFFHGLVAKILFTLTIDKMLGVTGAISAIAYLRLITWQKWGGCKENHEA